MPILARAFFCQSTDKTNNTYNKSEVAKIKSSLFFDKYLEIKTFKNQKSKFL